MMPQIKLQIDYEDFEFLKRAVKQLKYKNLREYMREAVKAKVKSDRKRLRELKRLKAREGIGKGKSESLFESIGGEDFEGRGYLLGKLGKMGEGHYDENHRHNYLNSLILATAR